MFIALLTAVSVGDASAATGTLGNLPGSPVVRDCEQRVVFALVDARTTGCLDKINATQWQTSDLVYLNGIPLPVAPGTKLTLTAPSTDSPGGRLAVTTAIALEGVTLKQAAISVPLPTGGAGEDKDVVSLDPAAAQAFLGFPVTGRVGLRIGQNADGTGFSRLVLVLALPSEFKSGPSLTAGGLTATLAVRAAYAGAGTQVMVSTDALKFEVANAYIGQTEVKNLCLSYTGPLSTTEPCTPQTAVGATQLLSCATGTDMARWDGSAVITLPTAARPQLGVFAGIKGGKFSYAGAQVTNLSVPVATGVFLDRFGLGVCLTPAPLTVTGTAGIRFGPLVAGTGAAYLNASLQYVDSRPWVVNTSGGLTLFDQNVASGYLKFQSSGAVDFGFNGSLSFLNGLLSVTGKVAGWYQPTVRKFDVFGSTEICVVVCVKGEAAASSVGVAGCADLGTLGYPEPYWFGIRWVTVKLRAGGGYTWATKKVDVMGNSCGTGAYRAQKAAFSAQSGLRTVSIQRSPGTVVRLVGRDAPPKVRLIPPGGPAIVLDTAGKFAKDKYLYAEDTDDKSTDITLVAPRPGLWGIVTLAGSSPLVSVSEAIVEPEASAAGSVDGTGATRTLHYLFEHEPNQQIEFFERGTGYEHPIGVASGAACSPSPTIPATPAGSMPQHPTFTCGVIAFRPAAGPAGRRNIVGVVENQGEATREIHVASYIALAQPKLPPPARLTILRNGTSVMLRWSAVAGASTYDVTVALNDGERLVQIVPGDRTSVTVAEPVAPSDKVSAGVFAVDSEEIAGGGHFAVMGQVGAVPLGPEPPPLS